MSVFCDDGDELSDLIRGTFRMSRLIISCIRKDLWYGVSSTHIALGQLNMFDGCYIMSYTLQYSRFTSTKFAMTLCSTNCRHFYCCTRMGCGSHSSLCIQV
jgi:hypothetical protein